MARARRRDEEHYEMTQSDHDRLDEHIYARSSFEDDTSRAHLLTHEQQAYPNRTSYLSRFLQYLTSPKHHHKRKKSRSRCTPISLRPTSLRRLVLLALISLAALIVLTAVFFPSYTEPPLRYAALQDLAKQSSLPGGGNQRREKVFIAASIFDKTGKLASGRWGESVTQLIHLLGPQNVYVSIYENDAGSAAKDALSELKSRITCEHALVFEEHLDLNDVPHITLPDGTTRTKRIEYLAEVRNRALRPLVNSANRFDKVLYLNDVVFDPMDAVHLLFSTNADDSGRAEYRAACAMDFINPFKYYDTFATRDIEGFSLGLPFFPWFSTAGNGASRREVLAGKDSVRVKSCWGGMVAFDARYLQPQPNAANVPTTAAAESGSNITAPYRFRVESDLYWDASECCLIHADIQDPDPEYSGIFINPYVRVAYDTRTLSWLALTRRFEKLYSPLHWIISKAVGLPWYNPRRAEEPGTAVQQKVWVPNLESGVGGSFQMVERRASHSGFCGRRALPVLKKDLAEGDKNWEFLPVPP